MIYSLKNSKKNFINILKNFCLKEEGSAVSILIIFTLTIISLVSLLLLFIYSWEISLIKEEISDVITREVYSTTFSKEDLLEENFEKYKKKIKKSIKARIIERFSSINKKEGFLRVLSNRESYNKKETKLKVNLSILNYENSFLIKAEVELKFIFPLLFLTSLIENDEFTNERNEKIKRAIFRFEEFYTIY